MLYGISGINEIILSQLSMSTCICHVFCNTEIQLVRVGWWIVNCKLLILFWGDFCVTFSLFEPRKYVCHFECS